MIKKQKIIRVMLVDDHDMVRKSLSISLRTFPDIEIVGEVPNGIEAVFLTELNNPDVIVMDLKMPEMDGLTAANEILKHSPEMQIIALSNYGGNFLERDVEEAGFSAYLTKSVSLDELVKTIRKVVTQK